ncbi:hypothetical protein Poli38472_007776 [Pythium oligandrum]|uniref:Uncharacterized protein n=1 Tax=Pythium oligandrum TaxID=41045 RepID=A0A8K1CRV4_PYTOL|nr:hypothetical protein Poli38472_007776 [Pythium oligandrum]|eukprot:TMW68104.1 hypothetical protein Poli38472_007776 [Pythium oligandrum]
MLPYRGWRHASIAFVALVLAVVSAFDFAFYPPFLPAYIAANETITHVELRVYLTTNVSDEAEEAMQVRITPTSPSITFSPSQIVFAYGSDVTEMMTLIATDEGERMIEYAAQVEQVLEDGSVVIVGSSAVVATQSIRVLPPPLIYDVVDDAWHGVTLLKETFDEPMASFWGKIRHGYPSDACGAVDGDYALYFTALGDRFVQTATLNLLGFNGKMHFHHLYGYRNGQEYAGDGDNRVSCERVDAQEEVVFSYAPEGVDPANSSAWQAIQELPLPVQASKTFVEYAVPLPTLAMQEGVRFQWRQKQHSSFPIDVLSDLSLDDLLAAENDDTSVNGSLGIHEREQWQYRNLFDQWALDSVRLEVRLNPPIFQIITDPSSVADDEGIASLVNTTVSIGAADVLVDSPVANTWVEFTIGDGTQSYPTCDPSNAGKAKLPAQTTRLTVNGYIHAIACLDVGGSIVSSFPVRSSRILVQARAPMVTSAVDVSSSPVDQWAVSMSCTECSFMRYMTYSTISESGLIQVSDEMQKTVSPSCSYGHKIDSTSSMITIRANSLVYAIACGDNLLPSALTASNVLLVAPRQPTFSDDSTATTITNAIEVTITPPDAALGVAYTITDSTSSDGVEIPTCDKSNGQAGTQVVTVRASDVIRAVACCVTTNCVDSAMVTWGPIAIKAVAPVFSMACSRTTPRKMIVDVTSVTQNAWLQYQLGSSRGLNCKDGGVVYTEPIVISMDSTSVYVVSCLRGLDASDVVQIPVSVDACCAGLTAYQYPSCAHVLLFHDDFTGDKCLDGSKWQKLTTQWGGDDVNGGVHADNAACVTSSGKNVLQLSAHGDLVTQSTPVGKHRLTDGSLVDRDVNDRYLEWALDGISPLPCNDFNHCPARRVGAAVATTLQVDAGVLIVRLKPCDVFGTLTQIWWGEYEVKDDETLHTVPFLPLWKAALTQAKSTSEVSYTFSSPSRQDGFVELVMQWNSTQGRANLYVDGQLTLKQTNLPTFSSSAPQSLALGVWFPNAVAGEPHFASCAVLVEDVRVFKAEITGERWCDYEVASHDVVPCTTDADCLDLVNDNCFLSIHEAICVDHDGEYEPIRGNDTMTDEEEDALSTTTKRYCDFRLKPRISTPSASTDMTLRHAEGEWHEEEH